MYCKPHRPGNTPQVPDNKGKCTRLVDYLSKESQVERPYYDNFFSQQKDYVIPLTVKNHIDNNHRTLKSNDDKFYIDRKSTRLNSSHIQKSRMPSSA